MSRFIINPKNYWNLQWNNFNQIIFVLWIIITPIMVSRSIILSNDSLRVLIYFDLIFMFDRFMDLFVGYFNPNGIMEHKLYAVIYANITPKLFIEIFIGFGPMIF